MDGSFKNLQLVPDESLRERIETVKLLSEKDTEAYEIVKDSLTGEHYLHYYYLQINLGGEGEKEVYNHLLPLESDDVLAILFDEQEYTYPDHWQQVYLRNGPEGQYVWFDPSYTDDYERNQKIGEDIMGKLLELKKKGDYDPETMRKFLEDIDRLKKDE